MEVYDNIDILGAKEHNLKNIDVTIPKNKLVVFAGVSGSGKSSLVFDTLARESSRQWQDSYPLFLRNKLPHYDRPQVDDIKNLPPSIVVNQKSLGTNTRSTVGTAMDIAPLVRLLFSRIGQPSAGGSMAYSFNHPAGMCPDCTGIGTVYQLIEGKIFDSSKSLNEGAICFSQFSSGWQAHLYQNNSLLDADKKLNQFSEAEWKILREGSDETIKVEIRSNNTGRVDRVDYEGVIPRFYRLYLKRDISKLKKALQEEVLSLVTQVPCGSCKGSGLNPKALAFKINGRNIVDYMDLSVSELLPLLEEVDSDLGQSLVAQISSAIKRMEAVGIGYLSLSRRTDTLSGGEVQRVKLTSRLQETGQIFVLDEPSTGLHDKDVEQLLSLLRRLVKQGNTVVMIEHRLELIGQADWIIDLGPEGGSNGGYILFEGKPTDIINCENSQTGKYLKNYSNFE
ncbi:ATP-binding cassette domain-containing protein [Streptococcus downei]|uniref:UvrABC system protein A n=1 Tax=Streptococcus downei MFe28 TaxID=764290 RepID=A0A380JBX3_STRDO|nr:ATP-binding cassette domain-containing protein [Streptococcus downei]EFQ56882.1 ABC transporter, ATP-binding protein [Streptococcus downei F0415]SUN35319.1 excinuclease ABC subunit A [Streptococcus downei MFe28]